MPRRAGGGKYTALVSATLLLALNFWAWSLLSPMASGYADEFSLSPLAVSILLATPVIVGALGRIPLGLLADRYGGRSVFAVVTMLAAAATVYLALADGYSQLLVAGLCIGIAGASFAIGVPFIAAWFPINRRGFALGVYALGNAGTAVSGFVTPSLAQAFGRSQAFLIVAVVLLVAGVAMAVKGRNAPGWKPAKASVKSRLSSALKWHATWKLSALYAVTFGAFVAFGLYLPVLLTVSYGLDPVDAAARAAGFIVIATLARPIGGLLSDKFGGTIILKMALVTVAILAAFVAFGPSLMPYGTLAYLTMAGILGVANGAIFGIVGHTCDQKLVGGVTGIIGAAGGLGGFFPPLVMGISFEALNSYSAALLLLSIACMIVLPITFAIRSTYK